jgi:hypothetical protein
MKKILVALSLGIFLLHSAGAQSNLPKYTSDVLVRKPTVIKSNATGNHPERKVTVKVWIEKDKNLGYVVYFNSSALLGDVEIKGTDPLLETQINPYEGKVDNGKFNLDAPAYKGRQSYTLTFFAQDMPKAIWTAEIKIIKQDFKIKRLPNN